MEVIWQQAPAPLPSQQKKTTKKKTEGRAHRRVPWAMVSIKGRDESSVATGRKGYGKSMANKTNALLPRRVQM